MPQGYEQISLGGNPLAKYDTDGDRIRDIFASTVPEALRQCEKVAKLLVTGLAEHRMEMYSSDDDPIDYAADNLPTGVSGGGCGGDISSGTSEDHSGIALTSDEMENEADADKESSSTSSSTLISAGYGCGRGPGNPGGPDSPDSRDRHSATGSVEVEGSVIQEEAEAGPRKTAATAATAGGPADLYDDGGGSNGDDPADTTVVVGGGEPVEGHRPPTEFTPGGGITGVPPTGSFFTWGKQWLGDRQAGSAIDRLKSLGATIERSSEPEPSIDDPYGPSSGRYESEGPGPAEPARRGMEGGSGEPPGYGGCLPSPIVSRHRKGTPPSKSR